MEFVGVVSAIEGDLIDVSSPDRRNYAVGHPQVTFRGLITFTTEWPTGRPLPTIGDRWTFRGSPEQLPEVS